MFSGPGRCIMMCLQFVFKEQTIRGWTNRSLSQTRTRGATYLCGLVLLTNQGFYMEEVKRSTARCDFLPNVGLRLHYTQTKFLNNLERPADWEVHLVNLGGGRSSWDPSAVPLVVALLKKQNKQRGQPGKFCTGLHELLTCFTWLFMWNFA